MSTGPGSVRRSTDGPADAARAARIRRARTIVLAVATTTIAGLAAGFGLVASGCGASYQAMYEGEVRFEHCYRLDEEPSVPLPQRRECWREWTQFYTFGQTRDRIEYALMRQRVLSGTGGSTTDSLSPDPTDGGLAPTPTLAAPPPTSPFAPPPQVDSTPRPVPQPDGGPPDAGAGVGPDDVVEMVGAGTAPPGQACLLHCVGVWKTCAKNCLNGNARCRSTCDAAFKACGRLCI